MTIKIKKKLINLKMFSPLTKMAIHFRAGTDWSTKYEVIIKVESVPLICDSRT
jgi:hypothetical protein